MSSTKLVLHSFPVELEASDYLRAQDEFLSRALRFEAVRSVLRFGSVSHPGLSDLDFILVVDDDVASVPSIINQIDGLSKVTQYVLYHPQFVLPYSLVEALRWLVPIFEFEAVHGPQPKLSDVPKDSEWHLTISFVLQAVLTDLSWVFRGMYERGSFDVRMTQAKLNLLAKNLQLATRLDASFESVIFPEAVARLRREWFQYTAEELSQRLSLLIHTAIEELARLCSWLSRQAPSEPLDTSHRRFVHRFEGITTRFSDVTSDLDFRLLTYLQPFCTGKGRIGDWIRNSTVPDPMPHSEEVSNVVGWRAYLAETHVGWLEGRGLSSGAFNYVGYPIGYRPGPRSSLRRALWNVQLLFG